MPPFPERESSILAILKKKKPGRTVEPIDPSKDTSSSTLPLNATTQQQQQHHAEPASTHQNGQTDLLVDVLGDMYSSSSSPAPGAGLMNNNNTSAHQNNLGGSPPVDNLSKLSWKNNGVLFENDILQIGVKAEYRLNLGRMTLFYGNKSDFSMLV